MVIDARKKTEQDNVGECLGWDGVVRKDSCESET